MRANQLPEDPSRPTHEHAKTPAGGQQAALNWADNRPVAVAQRQQLASLNHSPRVQQQAILQQRIQNTLNPAAPLHSPTAPEQSAAPVQRQENRTGLPDTLKAGVESLSGYSLDDVRVHYNSAQPAQLQAHAYAQGNDIHLAPGQEQHLPHEAWHVVQQKQGRVRPTMQLKGKVAVNDNAGLEKEADVMGSKSKAGSKYNKEEHTIFKSNFSYSTMAPTNIAQRVEVRLDVGNKNYNANYVPDSEWVTFQQNGQTCWLYCKKCAPYDKQLKRFVAKDFIVPFIERWIGGNLILYRGVDAGHKVYEEAKAGNAPAKPDAMEDIPAFTSDSSVTRFIPFSSSRDIALMGAKSSSNEGGDRHGEVAKSINDQIGVLLRIQVGTANTIAIFDDGEIQVLSPPTAHVIPIIGTTLQYGNRLDGQKLDEQAILRHLHERLDDPMWADLGEAFIGRKVPSSVAKMKILLKENNWEGILKLAQGTASTTDSRRHPETKDLYRTLGVLLDKYQANP